jgi:ATP-binding cassette, subfamily C, bacterial
MARSGDSARSRSRVGADGASAWRQLTSYLATFARLVPRSQLVAGTALVLAAALTDGIGLALLVPLIAVITASGSGRGMAARIFGAVGLLPSLPVLLAAFVGLIALRAVIVRQRDIMLVRLRLDFVDALRRRLYRAVAHAEWLFLLRERLSDIAKALTADVERVAQGTLFFLRVPATLAMVVVQLAIALRLAPGLTLATVALAGLLLVPLRYRLGSAYAKGGEMADANRAAFAEISALLDGLKLSKSHDLEDRHVAAFDRVVSEQRLRTLDYASSSTKARLVSQIGAGVGLGLYVLAAEQFAHLPAATLVVTVAIFARLLPLVTELQQSMQSVVVMLPVLAEWRDLAERTSAAAEPLAATQGARAALAHEIRLAGVHFSYDKGRREAALSDINLVFPARSITAIVGPSGAGKSTLADLVLGLIVPDQGQVLIDGTPLDRVGRAAWRRSVAYVPQENFLFNDTIRANLLWSSPDADDADIERALALAAADGFVARLPQGLDTVVGERGVRLSGGERQRLALARALLRRPSLLLLDEATSALDRQTESEIAAALERLRGRATVIVIAHRRSTIRLADRFIVVEGGRAAERERASATLDETELLP